MNIGWDAHLSRELNRYHEEGEAYMVQRRVEELQADIQRLAGELCQRAYDQRTHPLLQPLRDELGLRAQDERVVDDPQAFGAFQPAFEVGLGHVLGEVPQRLLPELRSVAGEVTVHGFRAQR